MKIRQICMGILLCLISIPGTQAQTFKKLWKQVEQAEKKSLPETVVKLTDVIYQKGKKEKNSPQMLKAYMWRMKHRDIIVPDSFYVGLQGLEQWAQQTDVPMDRAILHSLIAGFYADYVDKNQRQLRDREEIVGEVPTDMREWTERMFIESVKLHTRKAMEDSVLLLKTSSRNYAPFVELGETSGYYHHNMYHLLAFRSIDALSKIMRFSREEENIKQDIVRLYENMFSVYQREDDKEGYILTYLSYLKRQRPMNEKGIESLAIDEKKGLEGLAQHPYLAKLNTLIEDYKSFDICAEIYIAEVEYLMGKNQLVMAMQLCDEAIQLYPQYRRVNDLKNLRKSILIPSLAVRTLQVAFPGKEVKIRASHKNIDGFTVRLYLAGKLMSEQQYSVVRPESYCLQDTVFTLKIPEQVGKYRMCIVPDKSEVKDMEQDLMVTRFKVLTCSLPEQKYKVLTLDAQTGHPVPNACITLYNKDGEVLQQFTTGLEGEIVFPWKSEYEHLIATKDDDTAMPKQNTGRERDFGYYINDEIKEKVILLTDRSLYRPGQTVYVKGIAYNQKMDSAHVVPNKEYIVSLKDANHQEIGKNTLKTNEFGSFYTEFIIPAVCQNGAFELVTSAGSRIIEVEEYKRPTFDITFEKQQNSYRLGDEVLLQGKVQAYNGVLLQNATVAYRISYSAYELWRIIDHKNVTSGEVTADEDGKFTIPVRLDGDKRCENNEKISYRYEIEAIVRNAAGETQTSTYTVSAGSHSLNLHVALPSRNCKDDLVNLAFETQNLNGELVEVDGTYRLFRVKDQSGNELEESPVATGTFVSNKTMMLDWKNIPSGLYVLRMLVKDNQGKEMTNEVKTTLFSKDDRCPPVKTPIWQYYYKTDFDETHPAVFYFGTSNKNAYVMVDILTGKQMLESRRLVLSDSIVRFEFPYHQSYGAGIAVNLCMVADGEVYQESVRLKKREPNEELTMKWDVFRDRLRPGEKEEWKLTIKTPQGKAANAEMLATMYDISLDKISRRGMNFSLYYERNLTNIYWDQYNADYNLFHYMEHTNYLKVPGIVYDHFANQPSYDFLDDPFEEYMIYEINYAPYEKRKMLSMTGATSTLDIENLISARSKSDSNLPGAGILPEATTDIRTNLSETAFFYPQLRTNDRGEISFSFTMPQSLTRWNFRGYSHTKEMILGTLDSVATTSKEFMLIPNLPRFVRVGDKTSIAASISNMTGKVQSGTVSMILFDPVTDKVINTQKQNFTIEAGKIIGVNFLFTVSDKCQVLGCRMIADSGTFSDGEQQLLPVLSNTEHLVEALPIPVRGEETRTFSLDSLFNHHSATATDRKLTIEFTGNPSWYAVQTLPSLALPTNDNAISWATAYYSNTLAAYIVNSQPRIKAVFDSWKLQGGTKQTFLSNLQKNQEVKNILLSESPWMFEAQTEEQQKERIATLFDLNNIRSNNSVALSRLKELQEYGYWSWYKGMEGSRYLSTYIIKLNSRLAMLTGEKLPDTALQMQQTAFSYLHESVLEEYKSFLKDRKNGVNSTGLSRNILDYLYLIAISGEEVPVANRAAYAHYLSKVGELLSSSSMDSKAIAAIILMKAGRMNEAQEFIASLKEHLTRTDEQGMFFAFNESSYAWGSVKIQAHVDVMEALSLAGGNDAIVEEMKLWLLKQKQIQQWDSSIASAEAVYALLMKGTNLLDNQGDTRITIADNVLETNSPNKTSVPGLGYIKHSFTQKNVVDARTIQVEKKNAGIAWGAVYAEYESPIRDVKQQGGDLNVRKQLYVERIVNDTIQLQPITKNTILEVGDRVVSRLSIHVSRSMDFIQLKDQRGACFEPIDNISGYNWKNGFGYYIDFKDASTNFFFDHLVKGVYVLEHSYRVSREGIYETGLATIQCAYAPEYVSRSASTIVEVYSSLTK
ncbi:alpha-2-macroglobulin family protein [Bacteroides sp.]|uniref:alpha-2-macroglobulin family protein n=1 Tax=Bacteroides sp. TaxID=29523 RepID=UPI002619AF51|nr:alpha-2-macroglobulin family protein [Bacteroides sp.]MDD3037103.1 alpha-2-macroglobulin family protein [Bacteroides sp.]